MIKCDKLENLITLFIDKKYMLEDLDFDFSNDEIIEFLKIKSNEDSRIYPLLAEAYLVKGDYDSMHEILKLGISENNYDCYAMLGSCYQFQTGVEMDFKLAKKNYIIAARNGSVYGCFALGCVYLYGLGSTDIDYDLAFSWISKASDMGYYLAISELAKMYEKGTPTYDLKMARKLYIKAARLGSSYAQYRLGYFYENGIACEADNELALKWYTESANQNDGDALVALGNAYLYGTIVDSNPKKAFSFFMLADEYNNYEGTYYVGQCYEAGVGVYKDDRKAFEYYLKAAGNNNPMACYEVAECYRCGFGVNKNIAEAIKWYEKGIILKSSDCYLGLGLLYENGDGVDRDLKKSFDYYLIAANFGNPKGMFYVGISYDDGIGISVNKTEAFNWYLKAAENGNVGAMYNTAKCYDNGDGVASNDREAFEWYLKAANLGHIAANNDVGVCYRYGLGTDINLDEAFKHYECAANGGHYLGQCNLAISYENGIGTAKDSYKAFYYYECAAKNEKDNGRGKYELARCYELGIGCNIDLSQAFNYYLEASNCGYVNSFNKLGNIYQFGYKNVVEINYSKAFYYYEKGVINKSVEAYANYGYFYENGIGCDKDIEEAVFWYERGAKQQDPNAMYHYARMLESGTYLDKDVELAFEYYLKAAENGHNKAQYYVANCYKNGIITDLNEQEAFRFFKLASNSNYNAMNDLAECYENGFGVNKDEALAYELYLEASKHDCLDAIYNIGRCNIEGIGIKKNPVFGSLKIKQAIDKNHTKAIVYLAYRYLHGPIALRNYPEGFNLLRRGIKLEDKDIYYELGNCYLDGLGVKKDAKEAYKYYELAYGLGSYKALYQIGRLIEAGINGEVDKNKVIDAYQLASDNGILEAKEALELILKADEANILDKYKKAAEIGNSDACLKLSNCYLYGNGTDINYIEAFKWCLNAANMLNKEAINQLGYFYEVGIGVDKDLAKAYLYYKKSNDLSYPNGIYNLARCYELGIGVNIDNNYALILYKKAASLKDINALYYLGYGYINKTIKGSIQEGINYLRQGALLEDPNCQYQLGKCYFEGIGVAKNLDVAFKYYLLAAEANNSDAQNEVGLCYEYGNCVQIDKAKAIQWYIKAEALGNEKAQFNLARCYDEGVGVAQNPKSAYELYLKSAKKGDIDAQLRIAEFYLTGYGVECNETEAFRWFNKAADTNAIARFRLAELYLNGIGVEKNTDKALEWFKASSILGYQPATEAYEKLLVEIQNKKASSVLHLHARKDVFISWNHHDKDLKDELCNNLEKNGFLTVWESDGEGAGELDESISMAIKQAKSYIILVTEHSIESNWVKKEIELIFDKVEKNKEYLECIRPIFVNTIKDGYVSFDTSEEVNKLEDNNPFKKLLSLCSGFTSGREQGIDYEKLIRFLRNAIEKALKLDYKFIISAKFNVFNAALKNVIETQGSKSGIIASTMDFNQGYLERNLYDVDGNEITNDMVISNDKNVLIYGAGGTGKSLYLKNLIHKHFNGNNYIFYLPCKDMDKYLDNDQVSFIEILKNESFDNYFPDYNDFKVTISGFEEILKSDNNVIVLIDALDEITEKKKLKLLQKIDSFDDKYTKVKFIFTSRNVLDSHTISKYLNTNTLTYELRPLSDKDVSILYDKLSVKMNSGNDSITKGEAKDKFINAINNVTKEIIYNPLLLSNLIFIYFINNSIPSKKYDIIKQAVDIFIRGIDEERGTTFKYIDYIKGNGLNNILGEFAFERRLGNDETSESIIEYHLRSTDEKMGRSLDKDYEAISEEIVRYLRRRSILVGENISHEIFKDYFTISYLFNIVYRIDRFGLKKGYTFKKDGLEQLTILTQEYFSKSDYPWPNLTSDFITKLDFEIHVLDKNAMDKGNVSFKAYNETLNLMMAADSISVDAKNEILKIANDNSLYFGEFIKTFVE